MMIAANLVTSVPPVTFADMDKQNAYNLLNQVRSICSFGLLAYNAQLEQSGQNHVNYIAQNFKARPDALGHIEVSSNPGFTGVNPQDRNGLVGYGNSTQGEDFSTGATSATSQVDTINTLLTGAYHMHQIVGSGAYDVGIASAVYTPGLTVGIVELGSKQTVLQDIGSTDLSSYPCNGLTVKTSPFGIGVETPGPLPGRNYNTQPVGQPIYVRVRNGQTLSISSVTVVSATGTNVAANPLMTQANDPNKILNANEAIFFPNGPLSANTSYEVTATGTNNGAAFTKTFAFNMI